MPASLATLLRKNLYVELKSWKWFMLEVIIIITSMAIILADPVARAYNYYRNLELGDHLDIHRNTASLYDLEPLFTIKKIKPDYIRYKLMYTPRNKFTTAIVNATKNALNLRGIEGLKNHIDLDNHLSETGVLAGIEFHNLTDASVPEKLSITLRFPSKFRTILDYSPNMENHLWVTRCSGVVTVDDANSLRKVDIYLREGFLQLQHRLFLEWMKMLRDKDNKKEDHAAGLDAMQRSLNSYASNYSSTQKRLRKIQKILDESPNKHLRKTVFNKLTEVKVALNNDPTDKKQNPEGIPNIIINSMRPTMSKYVCYDEGSSNVNWVLWHFLFFIPFLNIVWRLARERETNISAHHYIYGYEDIHHFLGHFLLFFVHLIVLEGIIVIFILVKWSDDPKFNTFRTVRPEIMFTFFMLYNVSLIFYAAFISMLFSDAVNATLCGATTWIAAYGLFSILFFEAQNFQPVVLISLCTFCNNFFPIAIRAMRNLDKDLNYRVIYIILITQSVHVVLLIILVMVISYFKPPRYMTRTNFLYSMMGCRKRLHPNPSDVVIAMDQFAITKLKDFEFGPPLGKQRFYLRNISTFIMDNGKVKQQLRNITMRIYEGEITVILGAHDNGKAKLISLLAGWFKPEVGQIFYNTKDIYKNWKEYRRLVDVCMPYNALFDLLTVKTTLRYFGGTKQEKINRKVLDNEVEKWKNVLSGASINPSEQVKYLSYGQKCLLALCCAMMCDTPVILLHEPTRFLKDEDQRLYWRILKQEKTKRVIVVTTISIEEADAIGDRVGIISGGSLVAYGSPFYLRTTFGKGFDLIILKDPSMPSGPITDIINKFIPHIEPDNQIGDELIYKLPREKKQLFQRLLLQLEYGSESLGISHIRLFTSGLSEVFMTMSLEKVIKPNIPDIERTLTFIKETPTNLQRRQVYAMFYKKMLHQAPNVVPIVMVFVVLFLILLINSLMATVEKPKMDNGIYIGFSENQTTRSPLKKYSNDCRYIEIDNLINDFQNATQKGLRYYIFKSFICGNMAYERHLHEAHQKVYNFGAIEIVKPDEKIIIWTNDAILHSAPLILNLAHNYILEILYPSFPNRLTTIINKPLAVPLHVQVNLVDNHLSHLRVPLTMGIIMPITMSCFVMAIVEERHSYLMSLQRIAGIDLHIFWLIGMVWDLCTFFIFSLLYTIVMALTTIEGFNFVSKLLTLLLLNIHAVAVLSMMYLLASFMNKSKTRAYFQATLLQFIIGLCAYVFYWDVVETNGIYYMICQIFPSFTLLDGISRLYILSVEAQYCTERCKELQKCNKESLCSMLPRCCDITIFMWKEPGITSTLLLMLFSAFLCGAFFFLYHVYTSEKKYKLPLKLKNKRLGVVCYPYDDDDVVRERVRISQMSMNECKKFSVLADQIENRIPRHGKRLNTVSFALNKYMSMGIYGAHKSGKTHLINQLAGIQGFRFGELYLEGKDFRYDNYTALRTIGFCPDDNDLCVVFTPRQLFTLLFIIRGVPQEGIKRKLRELSLTFDLRLVMNTKLASISRAMRRRVSVAASLIIYNGILILDEPCRGMAAFDCRIIMNVLRYMRSCGKTIIFSSNSNLECQALADFIIVVQDGEMLAMGSPFYLRQKYTRGFYFNVKLHRDGSTAEEVAENLERDVENLLQFAAFLHEDSYVIYRRGDFLEIYVPVAEITFSYLYGSIEKNCRRLNIAKYTISQGSLVSALEKILATKVLREPYRKGKRRKTERKTALMSRII